MNKRIIGRTNTETSALGMGCWAIGGEWDFLGVPAGWGKTDDQESIRTIQTAFEYGIRLYDTAANYGVGLSESLLGKALGNNRKECVISTKFGYQLDEPNKSVSINEKYMTTSNLLATLEADCEFSLKRLQTDYIDVYFLHIAEHDHEYAGEIREALEKLVEKGKILSYGWSTDDVASAQLFSKGPHCSSIQFNLNIVSDNPEMIALCEEENMSGFNRGPLAMGFLTGKYSATTTFVKTDVRNADWVKQGYQKPAMENLDALREILTSNGRNLTQGALAWIWAKSNTMLPIPGFRTEAQAIENARAMEFGPLMPAQLAEIDEILG